MEQNFQQPHYVFVCIFILPRKPVFGFKLSLKLKLILALV